LYRLPLAALPAVSKMNSKLTNVHIGMGNTGNKQQSTNGGWLVKLTEHPSKKYVAVYRGNNEILFHMH
jgi:hypothetical protein